MKKYNILIPESITNKIIIQASFTINNNLFEKDIVLKWVNGIYDAINSLQFYPNRYPVINYGKFERKNIRQMIYKKTFKVIYDIKGDYVRILDVIHCKRV